jgi:hypothetical protein
MTGQLKAANGTVAAPSVSFGSDLDSGFYRAAANAVSLSLGGADVVAFATATVAFAGAVAVTGTLAVTGAVAFNGGITCDTDRFTVANTTGNTVIQGTLDIAGTTAGVAFTGTSFTATAALSGATVAGAMVATQANQETGTATDLVVTSGRQHFNPKHPKAWCNFNGSTAAVTVGSGVSAITDNGVGDYLVSWTVAFSTANYCNVSGGGSAASVAGASILVCWDRDAAGGAATPATTSNRITTFRYSDGAADDSARIYVAAFGDLA